MRNLLKIVLPVLLLVLGIGIFKVLKATRPERPAPAIEERVWRVEVQPVRRQTLAPQLVLYGQVETPELLKAAASRPARVAEVAVREGQPVAAGALLVQLDERDFLPALRQAEAQIAECQAQIESERIRHANDVRVLEQERQLLELAGHGVERAQQLRKQRLGSEAELDAAAENLARQTLAVGNREREIADHPARLQALEARRRSLEANRDEIALAWERARILAPFAGVVTGIEVTAGDQVKQDAVLLRLYALGKLEVRARIASLHQPEAARALAAGTRLSARARVGEAPVVLRLDRLSGEAQPSGIDGLFAVEKGGELLRLGQLLKLRLERPPQDGVIAVPFAAIYGGNRLYTLVEGRLRGIAVETLGSWVSEHGEERLLVRSADLAEEAWLVVTHLPNAIDGLRAEAVLDPAVAQAGEFR